MDITAVIALFPDLPQVELIAWVERGWVLPDSAESGFEFREIDVARVSLIRDLRHDMDVAEDAIPLVLSLLDQVYELRRTLRSVLGALEAQPTEIQSSILAELSQHRTRR